MTGYFCTRSTIFLGRKSFELFHFPLISTKNYKDKLHIVKVILLSKIRSLFPLHRICQSCCTNLSTFEQFADDFRTKKKTVLRLSHATLRRKNLLLHLMNKVQIKFEENFSLYLKVLMENKHRVEKKVLQSSFTALIVNSNKALHKI